MSKDLQEALCAQAWKPSSRHSGKRASFGGEEAHWGNGGVALSATELARCKT